MEKLFAELQSQHPDYEIVDIRFLANQNKIDGQCAKEFDEAAAKAVRQFGQPKTKADLGA